MEEVLSFRIIQKIHLLTFCLILSEGCGISEPSGISESEIIVTEGDNEGPTWSPDGRFIAYSSLNRTGGKQIWIYDLQQGTENQITRKGFNRLASWSPASDFLVFASSEDPGIWIHPMDDSSNPYGINPGVNENTRNIDWLPGGNYIAVVSDLLSNGINPLILIDLIDGSKQTQKVSGFIAWGIDDSTYYYASIKVNKSNQDSVHIIIKYNYLTDLSDTLLSVHLNSSGSPYSEEISEVSISPDEKWVVYSLIMADVGCFDTGISFSCFWEQNIRLSSTFESEKGMLIDTLLTNNGKSGNPSWSNDGSKIVFVSKGDIWIKDLSDITN